MSDTLFLKNNKVLTVDGIHPMYSDHCCCGEQPLTGKWFIDYFEFYQRNYSILYIWDFPVDGPNILQTVDIQSMQTLDVNWIPSAAIIYQPNFYDPYIQSVYGLNDSRLQLILRTKELSVDENDNLYFNEEIFKEISQWNHLDEQGKKLVSGNAQSGIAYNYNLSTNVLPITVDNTNYSGLISSIMINNVDNEVRYQTFITGDPFFQFSIKVQPQYSYYYPILQHPDDQSDNQYVPINSKVFSNNQYYKIRVFKGSQNGYVFTTTKPNKYESIEGINLANNFQTLGGQDDPPVPNKTIYIQEGYHRYYVRKENNKYYKANEHDHKIITEVTSLVYSTVISADPFFIIHKDGIRVYDQNYNQSTDPLSTTTDGIIENNIFQDWYNYNDSLLLTNPNTEEPESGQYFWFDSYNSSFNTSFDIDGRTGQWHIWIEFLRQYDISTGATVDVYQLGYFDDDSSIATGFVTSTIMISAYYYDQQGVETLAQWDSTNKYFYYTEGGPVENSPDYLDMSFDLPEDNSTVRYYVYKAPKWGGIRQQDSEDIYYNEYYLVSGDSQNSLKVYATEYEYEECPISSDWLIHNIDSNGDFNLVKDNGTYWYIDKDQPVIMTGGTLFNPQKSIAADNPNRPPYWWFWYEGQVDTIISSKYYIDDSEQINLVAPIYYDSIWGHRINTYSIDNYVPANWGSSFNIPNPAYYLAKDLINTRAYTYCNPFINYIATEYCYDNNDNNPTIAQYLTSTYIENNTPTTGEVIQNRPIYDVWWSYYSNHNNQTVHWGGNGPDSTDFKYKTVTQKFTKMTSAQIEQVPSSGVYKIDKDLSGALDMIDGLECQIITGFWIRKKDDNDSNKCGIRINGVFTQTLQFDTQYKFGYDLSNISTIGEALSNNTSICYTKAGNNLIPVHVNDYWASISGSFNNGVLDLDIANFDSFSCVRILRGNVASPSS